MKKALFIVPVALLLAGIWYWLPGWSEAARSDSEPSGLFDHLDPSWSTNQYWYDGTAELNFYDARIVKYGKPRETSRVVHILVTEDHLPSSLVKADDWRRPGLIKMLKFNNLRTIQTGIYEYREMMSVFFDVQDQHFAKMTYSSQEWCGNSFKEIVNFDGMSRFDFNTYWEGQGNGHYEVEFPRHLVLYDALPVQLRMLRWQPGLEFAFGLLPSQISSRASPPEVQQAQFKLQDEGMVEVPAGSFEAYQMTVDSGAGTDRFWFEKAFPHRMLQRETAAGDLFRLRATKKLAYWELNQPGDEAHLPLPSDPLK